MIIRFCEFGTVLGARPLGADVRRQLSEALRHVTAGEKVVFDFEGVAMVTHSFADECFAKLVAELGFTQLRQLSTFANTSVPVASVLHGAIVDRNPGL